MRRGVFCVHKPGFLMPGHIYIDTVIEYRIVIMYSMNIEVSKCRGGEHGGAGGAIAPPLCKVGGQCPPILSSNI